MSCSRPLVIVIDGAIGAGKTELIEKCLVPELQTRGERVTVVSEPVEKWKTSGALEQFYKDPARRAYQFQTRAFHDRILETQEQHRKFHDVTDLYILERSIFTDLLFMEMLFEDGQLDASEDRDYRDLWTMWRRLMPFQPDLFVYLKPSFGETMRRVRTRDRRGEKSGVSEDYQAALIAKHDKFLGGELATLPGLGLEVPVIRITTDGNFIEDPEVQTEVADQIYEAIGLLRN